MDSALLDTCVLYPATLRDVLLRLAEADLFGPMWSEPILTELERNVAPVTGDQSASKLLAVLRGAFSDSIVTGFEHLTATMTNDAKDRHVLAAAVHAEAHVLITFNLRDFPSNVPLTGAPVVHPDAFLCKLLDADAATVIKVLQNKVKDHRREPKTLAGLLEVLADKNGCPNFAEAVRRVVSKEHR